MISKDSSAPHPPTAPRQWPEPDSKGGVSVVISSILVHIAALGVLYSFGVYLLPIAETFETDRAGAAWVGSVSTGASLGFSALWGRLLPRVGVRPMLLGGIVLAAAGMLLASISQELWQM